MERGKSTHHFQQYIRSFRYNTAGVFPFLLPCLHVQVTLSPSGRVDLILPTPPEPTERAPVSVSSSHRALPAIKLLSPSTSHAHSPHRITTPRYHDQTTSKNDRGIKTSTPRTRCYVPFPPSPSFLPHQIDKKRKQRLTLKQSTSQPNPLPNTQNLKPIATTSQPPTTTPTTLIPQQQPPPRPLHPTPPASASALAVVVHAHAAPAKTPSADSS